MNQNPILPQKESHKQYRSSLAYLCPGRILLGALFLGGILLAAGCSADQPPQEVQDTAEAPLPAVETVTAARGTLISTLETSGSISGIREAAVISEAQGILREIYVGLGDRVEKGDPLARVDDEIPRLNMEQARQQLETARIEFNTQKQLTANGSGSRAQLAVAESQFRGAEARYQTARKAYEDCTIKAPISGLVAGLDKAVSQGNYLSRGQRVARIADTSSFQVRLAVGEDFVGLIQEGGTAEATLPAACPETVRTAEIRGIAAGSDPATGSYTVILQWERQCPSARAGMTARVRIAPEKAPSRLLIPNAALVQHQGRTGVFLAVPDSDGGEEAAAQFRPVTPGLTLGSRTAAAEGLRPGDEVIISGLTGLTDGTRIRAVSVGRGDTWE